MKKIIVIATLLAGSAIAIFLNNQPVPEKKITNSLAADHRFIDTAADLYFLENKETETVSLETLVEWSIIKEGERNWTRTLVPNVTYKCELTRTKRKYEIYHPSLKDPMIWDE